MADDPVTFAHERFGPRARGLPLKEGSVDFSDTAGVQQILALIGDAPLPPVESTAAEPFVGITSDGVPVPGLFRIADEGFDPQPATKAARAYLDISPETERIKAVSPISSANWRLWSNAFPTFPEHGVRLADLTTSRRESALDIMRQSLSAVGYRRLRGAMVLNRELGQYLNAYRDSLTEWCYWFTLFGEPSIEEPWGWQLAGHHIDVHCLILGEQLVLTPTFLGAEFRSDEIFIENRCNALEFINSLSPSQQRRAVLYDSMSTGSLPQHLSGVVDGRHRGGAGRDNAVLPYEGLRADGLSAGQRELLVSLVESHLDLLPAGSLAARRHQIEQQLDQGWFCWIGAISSDEPFYYRVHSPVVLVEYDNHSGIFIDNDSPEPFHVHTIVRTPNGGDYGKNLLAQHYALHH